MKYFIAVLLRGEVGSKFEELRRKLSEISGSTGALAYPPHITLRIPFETEGDIGALNNALKTYSLMAQKFFIMSTGLNYFEHKVCFLDVEQDPRLNDIAEDMDALVAENIRITSESMRYPSRHFHATLAFRDLTEDGFRRLRKSEDGLALPDVRIPVDHVALLRQEKGLWVAQETYPFGAGT